jgi:hypothetical protein
MKKSCCCSIRIHCPKLVRSHNSLRNPFLCFLIQREAQQQESSRPSAPIFMKEIFLCVCFRAQLYIMRSVAVEEFTISARVFRVFAAQSVRERRELRSPAQKAVWHDY